jgi:hypothetical protein
LEDRKKEKKTRVNQYEIYLPQYRKYSKNKHGKIYLSSKISNKPFKTNNIEGKVLQMSSGL